MSDFFDDDDGDEVGSNGAPGSTKKSKSSSEFAKLLEDSFKNTKKTLSIGEKIKSEILSISREEIFVSTGTMHDGTVPRKDLLDADGKFNHKVGDILDLYVTHARGSEIYLSSKPTAKNIADNLEDAFDMMMPIEGRVSEICKGGFRVSIQGKPAFCPISQMDTKRIEVETQDEYIGKKFEFLITQFTEGGRNIVVSRRKLLDEQKGLSESSFMDERKPGEILKGTVTRIEKFGAFVQIAPGIEGLVHVSELAWSRVSDPNEVVTVGQQINVKILSFEEKDGRLKISLSLKQAESEPWLSLPAQISAGNVVEGKVTRCVKFGAFVELVPGVEGLIPMGEMSDTKRVIRSDDLFKAGDRISVMIKDIKLDERRILLSLKDVASDRESENWKSFSPGSSGSFGTLGDQFRQALDKKKANRS